MYIGKEARNKIEQSVNTEIKKFNSKTQIYQMGFARIQNPDQENTNLPPLVPQTQRDQIEEQAKMQYDSIQDIKKYLEDFNVWQPVGNYITRRVTDRNAKCKQGSIFGTRVKFQIQSPRLNKASRLRQMKTISPSNERKKVPPLKLIPQTVRENDLKKYEYIKKQYLQTKKNKEIVTRKQFVSKSVNQSLSHLDQLIQLKKFDLQMFKNKIEKAYKTLQIGLMRTTRDFIQKQDIDSIDFSKYSLVADLQFGDSGMICIERIKPEYYDQMFQHQPVATEQRQNLRLKEAISRLQDINGLKRLKPQLVQLSTPPKIYKTKNYRPIELKGRKCKGKTKQK